MKKVLKNDCLLFVIGGVAYGLIEILWRKYTHWSMVITGGICFIVLYRLFKKIAEKSLAVKCVLGSAMITAIEFLAGCLFNRCLKMKVWDYSDMPVNFCGQICLMYSLLWGLLCVPIVMICKGIYRRFRW